MNREWKQCRNCKNLKWEPNPERNGALHSTDCKLGIDISEDSFCPNFNPHIIYETICPKCHKRYEYISINGNIPKECLGCGEKLPISSISKLNSCLRYSKIEEEEL